MSESSDKVTNLLAKNLKYSQTTHKTPPPLSKGILRNKELGRKGTVILSCADPRIHPEQFFNLDFSEAAIIRNAGGRTSDALRSILALDAVGSIGTVIVVHHTDCGMTTHTESSFRSIISSRFPEIVESQLQTNGVYGAIVDPEETVQEDVEFLKSFQSLKENMEIVGLVLDTFTGVLKRVV